MATSAPATPSERLFTVRVTRPELRGVHVSRAGGYAPVADHLGISVSTLSRRITLDEDFPLNEVLALCAFKPLAGVSVQLWSYAPEAAKVVRAMRKEDPVTAE